MNHLRLALLGLAAVAILILGASFLERAFRIDREATANVASISVDPTGAAPGSSALSAEDQSRIEAAIGVSPDYMRFFNRLRSSFPHDYSTILATIARDGAAAGQTPSADLIMTDTIIALRKVRGPLAVKASDEALAHIFALQLDEMRALSKRDVHLCVAFLYGANGAGFLDFAAANRALIADAGLAGLDAMVSGQIDRVQRTTPDDADFQALDRALTQKGLSRAEIEALLDGKTPSPPIGDDRMCVVGQTYLETLAQLDAGTRARLYGLAVDLMAKS